MNLLARLNEDGTVDQAFNPLLTSRSFGPIENGVVFDVQADGKIIVALTQLGSAHQPHAWMGTGNFGTSDPAIFRLLPDGSLDFTFTPPTRSEVQKLVNSAKQVIVRPNGDVLVNARINNTYLVLRFDTNGVADSSFGLVAPFANGGPINDIKIQGDDLVMVGTFESVNGVPLRYAARARLSDGTIDPTFKVEADSPINTVQIFREKLYITGRFTRIGGVDRFRFARLEASGAMDLTYDPGMGALGEPMIAVEFDGHVLVGAGLLERMDLLPAPGILRLETDRVLPGLSISIDGPETILSYSTGILQSSTDLREWVNIRAGGGTYSLKATNRAAFFRLAPTPKSF